MKKLADDIAAVLRTAFPDTPVGVFPHTHEEPGVRYQIEWVTKDKYDYEILLLEDCGKTALSDFDICDDAEEDPTVMIDKLNEMHRILQPFVKGWSSMMSFDNGELVLFHFETQRALYVQVMKL